MHGGAKGSGAPRGEANPAFRHGGYTAEGIAEREAARDLLRAVRKGEPAPPPDPYLLALLLELMGKKLTREEKRARNQAAWRGGDRTRWGGENRRGWPKHPGRYGYRGRQ